MTRISLYVVCLRARGVRGRAVIEKGLTKATAKAVADQIREEEPDFRPRVRRMGWRLVS